MLLFLALVILVPLIFLTGVWCGGANEHYFREGENHKQNNWNLFKTSHQLVHLISHLTTSSGKISWVWTILPVSIICFWTVYFYEESVFLAFLTFLVYLLAGFGGGIYGTGFILFSSSTPFTNTLLQMLTSETRRFLKENECNNTTTMVLTNKKKKMWTFLTLNKMEVSTTSNETLWTKERLDLSWDLKHLKMQSGVSAHETTHRRINNE